MGNEVSSPRDSSPQPISIGMYMPNGRGGRLHVSVMKRDQSYFNKPLTSGPFEEMKDCREPAPVHSHWPFAKIDFELPNLDHEFYFRITFEQEGKVRAEIYVPCCIINVHDRIRDKDYFPFTMLFPIIVENGPGRLNLNEIENKHHLRDELNRLHANVERIDPNNIQHMVIQIRCLHHLPHETPKVGELYSKHWHYDGSGTSHTTNYHLHPNPPTNTKYNYDEEQYMDNRLDKKNGEGTTQETMRPPVEEPHDTSSLGSSHRPGISNRTTPQVSPAFTAIFLNNDNFTQDPGNQGTCTDAFPGNRTPPMTYDGSRNPQHEYPLSIRTDTNSQKESPPNMGAYHGNGQATASSNFPGQGSVADRNRGPNEFSAQERYNAIYPGASVEHNGYDSRAVDTSQHSSRESENPRSDGLYRSSRNVDSKIVPKPGFSMIEDRKVEEYQYLIKKSLQDLTKITELQTQNDALKEKYSLLETKVTGLTTQNQLYRTQVQELEERTSYGTPSQEDMIKTMQKRIDNLDKDVITKDEEMNMIRGQLTLLTEDCMKLREDNENLFNENDKNSNNVVFMLEELEEKDKIYTEQLKAKEELIQNCLDQIQLLEDRIQAESGDIGTQNLNLQREVKKLTDELHAETEGMKFMVDENAILAERVLALKEACLEAQPNASSEDINQVLQRQNADLTLALTKKDTEIKELQRRIDTLTAQIENRLPSPPPERIAPNSSMYRINAS